MKAAAKRYRYTGMERDEETGLAYHGARYYASWLGRWTSCDPLDLKDSTNAYTYALNNPVIAKDSTGGLAWLIPAIAYLGYKALTSAGETAVEAGIAKATGDEEFSVGGSFLKNWIVNSTIGAIPGTSEAKIGVKVAVYGGKLALRTTADATLDTLQGKGDFTDNFVKSGVGNVGGDAAGALLKKGAEKVTDAIAEKAAKEAAEKAAKEAAEKAAKEAAEKAAKEAAEKTAKEAAEKTAKEAAEKQTPKLLNAGKPGSVIANKLLKHELEFAQEIVAHRGGELVGAAKKSAPGIDGFLDGVPVSLKETKGGLSSVLNHASRAEAQAKAAKYSMVELFIKAENVGATQLLDFARKGPLTKIPSQGVVSAINVLTKDGWIRFIP